MFEFEPDEYIFTKFAHYFKRRKKEKQEQITHTVTLTHLKPRLTLLARAITGQPIEIFQAQREGGYKDNSFFLPTSYATFKDTDTNISFYLFRVLFISIQKKMSFNFTENKEYSVEESRAIAKENASKILMHLFEEFPNTQKIHGTLLTYYRNNPLKNKTIDTSFLYGKWMSNDPTFNSEKTLKNFTDKTKSKPSEEIKTLIKAKAVEEIVSVEVDNKQLEDAVLQHQFEKVETAEEFGGNFRDMDGDDDLEDHENALEDLNMKYTVRVDDTAHSVYQADFMENTTISESAETDDKGYHLKYDEWNFAKRNYKEAFCKVYPKSILKTNVAYYQETITKNKIILNQLRKLVSSINNKYQQKKRLTKGEEIDIDAMIDRFVEVKSGHTPSEKIYISKIKREKDLSILILLDSSLSSDGYANGNRVIDVEKQASILFGEILDEFNVDFSIQCFHSKTRNYSNYITVKDFDEDWNKAKFKVGSIEPSGYTRIGPALRHSGALLDKRSTKNKWVILISDGKPNDYDKYEGKYGVNDVKQALRELNQKKINSYALAIEAQAKYYLPQMFGQNHYQILTTPSELLQSLVVLFDKIKNQS